MTDKAASVVVFTGRRDLPIPYILSGRRDEVGERALEPGLPPFPIRPAYHPEEHPQKPDWGLFRFAMGAIIIVCLVTVWVMSQGIPVVATL